MAAPSEVPEAAVVESALARLTGWVLRHRRLVAGFWLLTLLVGIASVGSATKAFSDEYSVPGSEAWQTNTAITRTFGNGGDGAPLVPVVTLPPGTSIDTTLVKRGLSAVERRLEEAVPGARVASYASTGDRAFVSRDGHTTLLAYPPPEPGSPGLQKAATAARTALSGMTVAASPVHLSGLAALSAASPQKGGVGLLAEGCSVAWGHWWCWRSYSRRCSRWCRC